MELLAGLSEPLSFSHAVGHNTILRLDARSGDDALVLEGSGDKVVTEEHNIYRGGLACIQTTRLVHIHVDRDDNGLDSSRVEQLPARQQNGYE
jgi:hypothetical protein